MKTTRAESPLDLMEAVPDGVMVSDQRGNVSHVNGAMTEMFGASRQTMLGRRVDDIIRPEAAAAAGADDFPGESGWRATGRKADGTRIPLRVWQRPVRLPDAAALMTIVRDLTEQEGLLRRARRLEVLIESSDDAISGCNMDGTITEWNSGAEKIYGYTAAEIEGSAATILAPDDLREETLRLLERVRNGEPVVQHQTRRRRKDGKEIWVSLSISPVLDEQGICQGVIVTAREITEQRRLQVQLMQAQKMEAVGQLTGGIAHDFNNLLTVMIMNLRMLARRNGSDEKALELIESATRSANQGSELTRRLLAFAKRQPLEPEVVALNERLADMGSLLRRTLGERISLRTELSDGLWATRIDLSQLESSVLNLALNARDAMKGGGCLTIETQNVRLGRSYVERHSYAYPGTYVMIAISDTGTGMPEETLERAFDPFFTTKPAGEGSGLGLSMVYGFIRQSGGYIDIYSEVGHGTTVKLYLPRCDGLQAETRPPEEESLPVGDETILVVDDNDDVRRAVAMFLEDLGYNVLAAENASAALSVLERESEVALLFTDIVMPGELDGLKLAEKAQELRPGIRILCASGYTEHSMDPQRFSKDGNINLLTKPYQDHDLAQRVRALLDGPA